MVYVVAEVVTQCHRSTDQPPSVCRRTLLRKMMNMKEDPKDKVQVKPKIRIKEKYTKLTKPETHTHVDETANIFGGKILTDDT